MRSILLLLLSSAISSLFAQPVLEFVDQMSGFDRPVDIANAGDGSGRLFVVEQEGRIKVITNLTGTPTVSTYLDLTDRIICCGERGALGLVFDPDFSTNGHFYLQYSSQGSADENTNDSVISRFTASDPAANVADPASEVKIDVIPQPFRNHNGGDLLFGPADGYLYVPLGDGGSGGDPNEVSLDPQQKLGKLLRYDVSGLTTNFTYSIPPTNPFVNDPNTLDLIYASGLRNPWGSSFDAAGNLWMADVGQNRREEVNVLPAGTSALNFGWDCREGFAAYTGDATAIDCSQLTFTDPVFDYSLRPGGRASITGGGVYRGSAADLQGWYLSADYEFDDFYLLPPSGSNANLVRQTGAGLTQITTFGEDEEGEMYVAELGGSIYRITTTAALPVALAEWTATAAGKDVRLAWATTAEAGAADFLVERSADGRTYETVATVAAAGHNSNGADYELIDPDPGAGRYYYRLTQRDQDGAQHRYAVRIVWLNTARSNGLTIAPNPSDGRFTTVIPEMQFEGSVHVRVYDSAGRMILDRHHLAAAGRVEIGHNLPNPQAGVYRVVVTSEGQTESRQLIVR